MATGKFPVPIQWSQDISLLARAIVVAGQTLFVAGPPGSASQSRAAYEGAEGAMLRAVSAGDGKTLAEYRLDALPVFDGLAAAQGRLYLAMCDGRLLCLGDRQRTPGGTELQRLSESTK